MTKDNIESIQANLPIVLIFMLANCLSNILSIAAHASPNAQTTVTVQREAKKHLRYTYTIVNPLNSSKTITGFEIDLGEESKLHSSDKIQGWAMTYNPEYASPYNPCGPSISWTSTDPAYDLRPGSSLIISFVTNLPPGKQNYSIYGWHMSKKQQRYNDTGILIGPGTSISCQSQ